ncbi:MAG: Tim44/TimA family putative adaptor protein [Bosea sp. (in: a-proteobacteria)]
MQGGSDLMTVVFLGLAVFLAWKLRSVLGTKTGEEKPPVDPFSRRDGAQPPAGTQGREAPGREDNVIRLPGAMNDDARTNASRWAGIAEAGTPLANGFDAIASQEPGFDPRGFLDGAKGAYEMVVTDFALGNRKSLKGLLSKDVFEGFDSAITEREQKGEKAQTTFVSVDKAEMLSAEVKGKVAHLTVRFASKLITSVKDASGTVIDGNPDVVTDVIDVWTFSRQLGARDPNWLLVATEAGG